MEGLWAIQTGKLPKGATLLSSNQHLEFNIYPVGLVRSEIKETSKMPLQGVKAQAEIFPKYLEALDGIERHSHLFLLCWLHLADRNLLKVQPRRARSTKVKKGVFSLRSPVRPNPIALCPVKLLGRKNNCLFLENVDVIDKTPIIDIKPYTAGWDCIFSAKNNSTFDIYSHQSKSEALEDMLRQAANFHGDKCVGVSIGVRAAYLAMNYYQANLQDKNIKITAKVRGCIADAVQALSGAGNKRFSHLQPEDLIIFDNQGDELELNVTKRKFHSLEEVMQAKDREIFTVKASRADFNF